MLLLLFVLEESHLLTEMYHLVSVMLPQTVVGPLGQNKRRTRKVKEEEVKEKEKDQTAYSTPDHSVSSSSPVPSCAAPLRGHR
jgi:hypothetical protein